MKFSKTPLDDTSYIQVAKYYYYNQDDWLKMTNDEKHIAMCHCVSKRRKNLMFTGQSACVIHNIPRLNRIDLRPHCISEVAKGTDLICWRRGARDVNAIIVDNLLVASPARTICDLAKYDSPHSLLVSINHCLNKNLFAKNDFSLLIENRHNMRWKNMLKKALSFSSAKCDSPLETIAWIAINNAGFVIPSQQVVIRDKHNFVGRVDMYWEYKNRRIILELDGNIKYTDQASLIDEKNREDKLRELGYEIIRASWNDVSNGILIQKLNKVGLPKLKHYKNKII